VFSATHTARQARPEEKGQESWSQGVPWVSRYKRFALKLKGLARNAHANRLKGSASILAVPGGPSGPIRVGAITQGKPRAMLSWPLRATDWKRPNSSGPYDAKHIRSARDHAGTYGTLRPSASPWVRGKRGRITLGCRWQCKAQSRLPFLFLSTAHCFYTRGVLQLALSSPRQPHAVDWKSILLYAGASTRLRDSAFVFPKPM
jgi:hypothetical protein